MRREKNGVRRAGELCFLVALVVVGLLRTGLTLQERTKPRATRETRYVSFAWREPRVEAMFAEARETLRPREPVVVAVAGRNVDHLGYWRGMALYWLPAEHRVAGVRAFGLGVRDLWLRGAWPVRHVPEIPADSATLLCRKRGIEVRRGDRD